MLYAGDEPWWREYGAEAERDFQGELWTRDIRLEFANYVEGVDDPGLCLKPGRIHLGGHSGYQLLNLVYHWGVSRIILLGYDTQLGPKGEKHHHGNHPAGLSNLGADLKEWARRFIQLGIDLRAQGVEVINASRRTAITCFDRMPIERALGVDKSTLLIPQDLLPREHEAFSRGLAAAGYPAVTVSWGCRPPAEKPKGLHLIAENGYLAGPCGPYVALAIGAHNGAGRIPEGSPERWDALGVVLAPWRATGGHVLVCPSRGLGAYPMPKDWTEKTVARLRQLTDREIRVRPHPGPWKARAAEHDASLRRDLEGAWCCVTWASTAGIKALIAGVPTIFCAPYWICADAAGNRLEDIEVPLMPDRLPVFHRLAWAQWSLAEISSGEAFRYLLQPVTNWHSISGEPRHGAEAVLRSGLS